MSVEKNTEIKESTEIAIVDEYDIRDKIYEVRGVKVMLDFELAGIRQRLLINRLKITMQNLTMILGLN